MNSLQKEKIKIEFGQKNLKKRRQNWEVHAKPIIQKYFDKIIKEARKTNFPFSLHPMPQGQNINEDTIQISAGINPTGVIINETKRYDNSEEKIQKPVLEKGCSLVASLSINGTVSFIISPYKSERHSLKEENIFLYYGLSPEKITEKLVKKCISSFLFYSRFSSIFGISQKTNFVDLIRYYYIVLRDIRNREKIVKTTLTIAQEWYKVLLAGIAGYIVAVLTQ